MRDWVSQLRRGLLELCLLNLLERGESYGYEIVKRLEEIEELSVTESTVYPILSRLRRDGYLKVRSVPSPGGPPRRYFSLTRPGRSYLRQLNDYWDDLGAAIQRLRSTEGEHGD
jgi:PadR family transcriptional regulator PadR